MRGPHSVQTAPLAPLIIHRQTNAPIKKEKKEKKEKKNIISGTPFV
jgi:hypothetical protein